MAEHGAEDAAPRPEMVISVRRRQDVAIVDSERSWRRPPGASFPRLPDGGPRPARYLGLELLNKAQLAVLHSESGTVAWLMRLTSFANAFHAKR